MNKCIFLISLLLLNLSLLHSETILHFSFDNTGADSSGNGHSASLQSGASFGAGKFGQALDVSGGGEHATAGDVAFMDQPGQFSVSYWFFRRSEGPSTNHGINNLIVANSGNGPDDNLEMGSQGSRMEVYLDTQTPDGSEPNPFSVEAGIANSTWHHVVLTYDKNRANEMELYVDGALVIQQSLWQGDLVDSTSAPLAFGLALSNNSGPFDGLIDEFYVFDNALNAQEVANLRDTNSVDAAAIPEPATWLGLVLLGGLCGIRRNWQ